MFLTFIGKKPIAQTYSIAWFQIESDTKTIIDVVLN